MNVSDMCSTALFSSLVVCLALVLRLKGALWAFGFELRSD